MGVIKRQGIKNTVFTYAGVIIGFLNLIVIMPLVLSPQELGLLRIMYSATILFGTLFPVGLNFLTVKFFPRFKNPDNGNNGYLGLLFINAFTGFLILSGFFYVFRSEIISHYQNNSKLFVEYFNYIIPIGFCIGITTILTGYLNVLFKSTVPTFLNEVFVRLWMSALLAMFYFHIISFHSLMNLYMGSYIAMVMLLVVYIIMTGNFSIKVNWNFFRQQNRKEIAVYTLLLALASVASIGIRNIDTMMIGSLINLDSVAVYSIAFTIGSIIETPVNALGKIADSKISHALAENDRVLMQNIYYKSTKFMTILGGFLFVMICSNISDGLQFLPAKYHGCENVVYLVAISAFANMATGVNTSLIYYSNNYKTGTWFLFIMIALSIVLNAIFIPRYGLVGAALSTGSALIIYNVLKFLLIYRQFKFQPFGIYLIKILAICGLLFFAGIKLFDGIENLFLRISVRTMSLMTMFFILHLVLKVDSEIIDEFRTFKWKKEK